MGKNIETFDPENQTISEIFKCDEIYRIPEYQRQYSWTDEHLEELWEDLYTEFTQKNKCYFLGSIVVVENDIYHDLIDGQQRITTLMIMLNVLEKNFADINKNNKDKRTVKLKTIQDRIKNENDYSRLQLQSYKAYDSIFKKYIINAQDFSTYIKPNKKDLNSNEPKFKYINTAHFFYNNFKNLSDKELGKFVDFIFYNVNIIKIICSDESFAIKLFQVLNDRGLDLSGADIIKAYMIGKFPKKDTNGKSVFESNWSTIENTVSNYDLKMDDFLTYYMYYKLGANPKRQMSDEMKKIIDSNGASTVIYEMSNFADSMKEIFDSKDNTIYSLRYIPWNFYVTTILTTAEYVNYPNKEELFKEIRRFFYICLISGKTLNGIKQTSFNLISLISQKTNLSKIKELIDKFIEDNRLLRTVYLNLKDKNVYGEKWLKPLLLSLDYTLRDSSNTTFVPIDSKLNIDHILPIAYKNEKNKEWSYIDENKAMEVIDSLGNMALLTETKNKQLLHRGFEYKIKVYQGKDEQGNDIGGFITFQTTINIITEYNKTKKLWDTYEIKQRTKYLIKEIEKMLDIEEPVDEIQNIVDAELNKLDELDEIEGYKRKEITIENVEYLYDAFKKFDISKTRRIDLINDIAEHTHMNSASVTMYIAALEHMLKGEMYKRRVSARDLEYFLNKIKEDYGVESLKKAINATKENIKYAESFGKKGEHLKEVINKFDF